VLITHNHYDHLDGRTVARLWRRDRPRIIAPLGNDATIRRFGRTIAVETYDWGDRVALSDALALHLEPAFHWSGRRFADRRMALWCAFVLIGDAGGLLYHVGDTAYGDGSISASSTGSASDTAGPTWRSCRSAPTSRAGSCRPSTSTRPRPSGSCSTAAHAAPSAITGAPSG
jgi:L-ascorbate metabolism protein UlaG (beta-lactamase superfamily)